MDTARRSSFIAGPRVAPVHLSCRYLNNIVEQDHRAIKRRCASMAGFKSFDNAAITIAGNPSSQDLVVSEKRTQ
jgi:transposase-like protein